MTSVHETALENIITKIIVVGFYRKRVALVSATDYRHVQDVPCLSLDSSWDRLQHPQDPILD